MESTLDKRAELQIIEKVLWSELTSVDGEQDGCSGQVTADIGNHSDPSTGLTVPNQGSFRWSATLRGWTYVGPNNPCWETDPTQPHQAPGTFGADLTRRKDKDRQTTIRVVNRVGILVGHKYGFAKDITRQLAKLAEDIAAESADRKSLIDRNTRHVSSVKHKHGFHGTLSTPAIVEAVGDGFGSYTGAEVRTTDQWAKYRSAESQRPINPNIASILKGYVNGIIVGGQSRALGSDTWPALSVTSRFASIKMLGASERGVRSGGGPAPNGYNLNYQRHQTIGDECSRPYVATNDDGSGAIYSREDIAAVLASNPANGLYMQGEGHQAALNIIKESFNRSHGTTNDIPEAELMIGNTAQGGRSVQELSKGHWRNIYSRNTSWYDQVLADAKSRAKNAQMICVLFLQGETNYLLGYGGEQEYYDRVLQLSSDLQADLQPTGALIAFICEVPAAPYAFDDERLKIAQAYRRLARDNDHFFLVGPAMAETDRGGHRDANGQRWASSKVGQVASRILVERRNWRPLDVFDDLVTLRGMTLKCSINLPVGSPIRWRSPIWGNGPVDMTQYPQRGFRLTDDNGDIPLIGVPDIIGDATVGMKLSRAPVGPLRQWLGDRTLHSGCTFISDSDPFVTTDVYEWVLPMTANQAIADLVGKPYPMHNQIIPSCVLATLN